MKKTVLLAALPLSLALTACGEELDGGDTADLGSDVTTGETGMEGDADYEPGEDGPLQNDVVPDETMTDEGAAGDAMMVEDAPMNDTMTDTAGS